MEAAPSSALLNFYKIGLCADFLFLGGGEGVSGFLVEVVKYFYSQCAACNLSACTDYVQTNAQQ